MGYHRAGFEVYGVDCKPQPRYPFPERFEQRDAMESLLCLIAGGPVCGLRLRDVDAIHASPPCQRYSKTQNIWGREYVDLLPETRRLLIESGRPYVIENVEEAPLGGIKLCGMMFGLKTYRHRRFETSHLIFVPDHPKHKELVVPTGHKPKEGQYMTVAGNFSGIALARKAMGIDWMNRKELAQAIPPAYCEYIGKQLLEAINGHVR